MNKDFSNQLKNLVSILNTAVDDVDELKFMNLLEKIVVDLFGMTFYEVQIEDKPNQFGDRQLTTVWSNYQIDNETTVPIHNPKYKEGSTTESKYTGQTTYAFDQNKCMWITAKDKSVLKSVKGIEYVDSWSKSEDIPPYWDCETGKDIRTSIIIPLKVPGMPRPFGFINFESEKYLVRNDELKSIFKDISNIVAIYIYMLKINKFKKEHLMRMMDNLITKSSVIENLINKSKVFVAFPARKDDEVMSVIEGLLGDKEDQLAPVFWNKMRKPGIIDNQLANEITSCKYAIVYLSEEQKDEKKGTQYVDNLNVFFEAGMLHALSWEKESITQEWILIHEEGHQMPFDLKHLRAVVVKRADGKIKETNLAHEIKEIIKLWK